MNWPLFQADVQANVLNNVPSALPNALLIVLAMSVAAVAHLLWLRSAWAGYFSQPVDGGLRLRGRRLFGDNKQVRGFMMLPLAAAASFAALPALRDSLPNWLAAGLWQMPVTHYAVLGFSCGFAFMLAELPNSFLKRQLDVAPGQAAQHPAIRLACALLDRVDSACGVILACHLLVPQASFTWFWLLLFGPALHACFSVVQYAMGLKGRAL